MKLRSADHGHNLLEELERHVDEFHSGLTQIEDRILRRRDAVRDRMAELEDEHAVINDSLDNIDHLRQ